MARFAAVLLAAAALLAAGRLSHAAPSTAEVFWRAVLPGSAVPDAVLRFLRPDSFVSKAEAEDADRSNSPFDYQNYERSSAPYGYDYKAPDKGAAGGGGARDDTPFGYDYKAPSKAAADGGGSRADTPFGYDYKAPGGHRHAGAPLQPYTVRAVRRVGGAGFVACHDEAYPYTVYRCHGTGPARAYMVEMEGTRGGAVTVATVCHTDTSRWNPEHVSFKLLGTKPGGAPICHLMPYGHIIWANNEKRSPA